MKLIEWEVNEDDYQEQKDSPLINDLIDHCLELHERPFALALIGLAAHVYADTFSHSGFSGVSSRRNKVDASSITPQNATAPTAQYISKIPIAQQWL